VVVVVSQQSLEFLLLLDECITVVMAGVAEFGFTVVLEPVFFEFFKVRIDRGHLL